MRLTEYLSHALRRFMRKETGVSFMEYALVGLLVAVLCTLALLALGKGI